MTAVPAVSVDVDAVVCRPDRRSARRSPVQPRSVWRRWFNVAAALGDAAMAFIALALVLAIIDVSDRGWDLVFMSVGALLWVAWMAGGRAYDRELFGEGHEEYRRVAVAGFGAVGAVGAVASGGQWHWGRAAVMALAIGTMLTLVWRWLVRRRLHRIRLRGVGMNRAVLVGSTGAVEHMAALLAKPAHHGTRVVGAVLPAGEPLPMAELVWDARSGADIARAAEEMGADEVILLNPRHDDPNEVRDIMWALADKGIGLMIAPVNVAVSGPRIGLRPVDGLPLMNVAHPQMTGLMQTVKNVIDRAVSIAGLLVLSPLMLAIAATIRLTSAGPALFKQKRVGRDGEEFTMYKFRSMVVDAEQRLDELQAANVHGDPRLFKIADDPRVTPIGRFIRKFSLDELPQLINVAKGDMSLVGPRPPLPREVEHYTRHGWFRMKARPGITGLWQVSGRADLDPDESLELDLRYVENWSLSLDASIMWKTGRAVLAGAGAY